MILINFAHPITAGQQAQLTAAAGQPLTAVYDIPCQLDNQLPFVPQVQAIIDSVPLSPAQWQSEPLLINPPAFAPATLALIAELHGRIGHFPTIIRIRPVNGDGPTRYEVAELLNLQSVREQARRRRTRE